MADPAAASSLRGLNSAANGADPLRYAFITSQAQLVDSQVELSHVLRKSVHACFDDDSESVSPAVFKGLEVKCLETLSNKTK